MYYPSLLWMETCFVKTYLWHALSSNESTCHPPGASQHKRLTMNVGVLWKLYQNIEGGKANYFYLKHFGKAGWEAYPVRKSSSENEDSEEICSLPTIHGSETCLWILQPKSSKAVKYHEYGDNNGDCHCDYKLSTARSKSIVLFHSIYIVWPNSNFLFSGGSEYLRCQNCSPTSETPTMFTKNHNRCTHTLEWANINHKLFRGAENMLPRANKSQMWKKSACLGPMVLSVSPHLSLNSVEWRRWGHSPSSTNL